MQKNKKPTFIQIQKSYFKVDEIIRIENRKMRDGQLYIRVVTKEGSEDFNNKKAEDVLKRMNAKIIEEK